MTGSPGDSADGEARGGSVDGEPGRPPRLRWAALSRADTAAWAQLTEVLAVADDTEEFYSADDLAEELVEAGFDAARDSWSVWDGADLVGFGQLRVSGELVDGRFARAQLDGGVHPRWRRRGIGTRLMELMEARARELAGSRHPGAPLQLRAPGRSEGDPVRALLGGRGYSIARYFVDMERELPGAELPEMADVASYLVGYQPKWAEATRQAHNAAFASHWGSAPQTVEGWQERLTSRTFRPGTSVLWVEGGRVLSYVLTYQWVDGELYIGQVGTCPEARGRGLARACLVASLVRAQESGVFTSADLTVDADSPTGAGGLYESVGFTAVRTSATFTRDEPGTTGSFDDASA